MGDKSKRTSNKRKADTDDDKGTKKQKSTADFRLKYTYDGDVDGGSGDESGGPASGWGGYGGLTALF